MSLFWSVELSEGEPPLSWSCIAPFNGIDSDQLIPKSCELARPYYGVGFETNVKSILHSSFETSASSFH